MNLNPFLTLGALIASCVVAGAESKPSSRANRSDRPEGPPPEVLKEFDKDGDGKLSLEERKAMREAEKAYRDAEKAKAEAAEKAHLAKYDADHDGKLSPEETAKVRADKQAEELKRYDKDGDGKLSAEEREAIPKRQPNRRSKTTYPPPARPRPNDPPVEPPPTPVE